MDRKRYSLAAASYLMSRIPDDLFRKIRQIILFGSVATGTAGPESDVDIFIDCEMTVAETYRLKRLMKKAAQDFSITKDALLSKLEGVDNPLSIQVGKLEEWQDLRESIEVSGIVLYGAYTPSRRRDKRFLIFHWDKLGIPRRGAFLNKLYGYKAAKRYPGLLEKIGGRRIGKSAILVPVQRKSEIMQLMEKYSIDYKVVEV